MEVSGSGQLSVRAPLINSERIRQLREYADGVQIKIDKMKKTGNSNLKDIIVEKRLLKEIRMQILNSQQMAIQVEFENNDYFGRFIL